MQEEPTPDTQPEQEPTPEPEKEPVPEPKPPVKVDTPEEKFAKEALKAHHEYRARHQAPMMTLDQGVSQTSIISPFK